MDPVPRTSHRSALRRLAALAVTALLTQLLATTALAADPAAAAASLGLDKRAPSFSLAGAHLSYTLSATNPGNAVTYNLSFADRLPPGASYVPGSTSPASAGEPTQSVDPTTGGITLVWRNLADLGPGGDYSLRFTVAPGTAGDVVGESMLNSASEGSNSSLSANQWVGARIRSHPERRRSTGLTGWAARTAGPRVASEGGHG